MIEVGKINRLIVNRETNSGFYLKDLNSDEEVFIPPAMAPLLIKINEEVKVFVYTDTKGKLIATVQTPHAEVGEFALLRAVNVQEFGAFFEWGIEKDLLVPGNEQKFKVKKHEDHLVRICLEEGTNRLYGTTKLGKYINESIFDFEEGENVKLTPVRKTDLGYRVIINKKFIGMIYQNEIFTKIQIGETYNGFVKKIREDNLLDAALQEQGIKNLVDAKDKILNMLHENNGRSILNDKSSPDKIKEDLSISKQTFKNAIGMLYKERKITISKDGIELINK